MRDATYESTENRPSPVPFPYGKCEHVIANAHATDTFLLIFLVTISALFELDAVLGAFAAGFILRYIIPDGSKSLEMKLEGVGYGFLIPVFFVVSGAAINVRAWQAGPRCSSRSSSCSC